MTNNDILRRLRFTFDFDDHTMMLLFKLGDKEQTRAEISSYMKREEDEDFEKMNDKMMSHFLNGFIVKKRGKREGPPAKAEKRLTNNLILRKLKIALSFRDEDFIEVFKLVDVDISKHEVSAFFRNPEQRQFRLCRDQLLRKFLKGLQIQNRGEGFGDD